MPKIVIHCIPEPDSDPADEVASLDSYLRGIDGVDPVLVEAEQPRLGVAEVLAILQLADTAVDLVQKLRDYLQARRGKVKDIQIEIDGHRVPVASLTTEQRNRLETALNPPGPS